MAAAKAKTSQIWATQKAKATSMPPNVNMLLKSFAYDGDEHEELIFLQRFLGKGRTSLSPDLLFNRNGFRTFQEDPK